MESGFFASRAKAQEAIAAGLVHVDDRQVAKASTRVQAGCKLQAAPAYPWVSRGGVKLAFALDRFAIDPAGRICLDVGASTGGFTDVLLSRGAAHVYAADVGRDQLHPRIASNPRVSDWAETDARTLPVGRFSAPPSVIVCDVSFISLTLVLPPVLALASTSAELIALIKPQFEVGRGGTDKGIVRDSAAREKSCRSVDNLVADLGWTVLGLCESPIAGGDGNIEYLIAARRA